MHNSKYCCEHMERQSELRCDTHSDPHDCPDILVIWSPQHGPGIPVRDGGSAIICIKYCPWCGTELQDSLNESV